MHSTPLGRCIVYLKRIAAALDRIAPPDQPRRPKRSEFSVATAADFERGYDGRNIDDTPSPIAAAINRRPNRR